MLEQKITAAKAERRHYFIKVGMGIFAISLLCALVLIFVSPQQFINQDAEIVTEPVPKIAIVEPEQLVVLSDEQRRTNYIQALNKFENKLKPKLDKIDLNKWDKARSDRLTTLKDQALSDFTAGQYIEAEKNITALNQLAQTTIDNSQKAFEQAFSNAQDLYNKDNFNDAKHQIETALMHDKASVTANELSTKIDKLPEILQVLEKIYPVRYKKQLEAELSLIKDLLKLAPNRKTAIKRKQVLINSIGQRNFKSYIAQSRRALKQGDISTAKQKLVRARKISSQHKDVIELTQSIQNIERNHRLSIYQQKAQTAIKSDDWKSAKKQLTQALQLQPNDSAIKQKLALATSISSLNDQFKQLIKSPHLLSNKQLVTRLNSKISQVATLAVQSPSLNKNTETLTRLIKQMNSKVSVQVTSDNETTILVRGVGVVGETLSKTIQLLPGKYTFEGKRKGFKSKLIDIKVPPAKPLFQVTIVCDERI